MTRLHEVAAGVLVATSRTDSMNSVIVEGRDHGALLIDPAWHQDELDALVAEFAARGLIPAAGLSTHAHHDHLLWHPAFGDVPRWASPDTVRIAGSKREDLLDALGPGYSPETLALFGRVAPLPGLDVPWPGPEIDVILHDAHIVGHTAAWIAGYDILVAGDMLSDTELPLPDEEHGALATYRSGLETLAPYAAVAKLVIPGHGTPTTDGLGRLQADRRYLNDLLHGRESADPRLENSGMLQVHAANCSLV